MDMDSCVLTLRAMKLDTILCNAFDQLVGVDYINHTSQY